MVIFIELVQYAKNLGGKSKKNMVEHQRINMIRKFNSIICRFFFAPYSQDNTFNLLLGPIPTYWFPCYGYASECLIRNHKQSERVVFLTKTNLKMFYNCILMHFGRI